MVSSAAMQRFGAVDAKLFQPYRESARSLLLRGAFRRIRVDGARVPGECRAAAQAIPRPAPGKNFRMLLAFGFGFTARALARRWRARGLDVVGTARRGGETGESAAVAMLRFDAEAPLGALERALAGATHVLVSIPPAAGYGDAPAPAA